MVSEALRDATTDAQKMAPNKQASNNINENSPAANILGVLPPTEQPMSTKQTKPHSEADFCNFFPQNPLPKPDQITMLR